MNKEYKVVGELNNYQILECFGAYRLSKKHFKTVEQAEKHITIKLNGKVKQ